jgi:hypothetical protein
MERYRLTRQPPDGGGVDVVAARDVGLGLARLEPSTWLPSLMRRRNKAGFDHGRIGTT